jgi:D-tagatose-1,6-bisphosphate aldolase subunit GatZ/KbaZ
MVQDHFAILKVGPALTFAFREGVFALAMIENEFLASQKRSNIISSLEKVMIEKSEYWVKYYHGDKWEEAFKRKYSLSDRIRYYWTDPSVQKALGILMTNLDRNPIPATLLRQYVPDVYSMATLMDRLTPESIVLAKIQKVLEDYAQACQPN